MSTKFIHLRKGWSEPSITDTGLVFVDHLLPHGGATIAFEATEAPNSIEVAYSYALCSDRDNYDKARGRTIAAGRLHRGNGHVHEILYLPKEGETTGERYRNLEAAIIDDFKRNVQGDNVADHNPSKFCINCVHCRAVASVTATGEPTYQCSGVIDLVTGRAKVIPCREARDYTCRGELWEEKK